MNNAAESTEKYSAPALSKGLDILELLAEQSLGLKKNEIAFALGISVSELYRMLIVLVNRGYVNFDGISERHSLSMRLFEMSNRYPLTRRLTAVSCRIMEETALAMNQSVHLAIPYGSKILIIAQVDSPGNNIMLVRLGAQVPMVLASSGASLLYRLPKPDRCKICAESGEFTEQNMEVFERAVEQVLSTGVCESPSSIIEGVLDLSVPITGYGGDVVAALTVPHVTRLNSVGELGIEESKQVPRSTVKCNKHLQCADMTFDQTWHHNPSVQLANSRTRTSQIFHVSRPTNGRDFTSLDGPCFYQKDGRFHSQFSPSRPDFVSTRHERHPSLRPMQQL